MTTRDPRYGVPQTFDELSTNSPTSVVYGVTPSNKLIPLKCTAAGELVTASTPLPFPQVDIGNVGIMGTNPTDDTDQRLINFITLSSGYSLASSIIDASGTSNNGLVVNADGSINTKITGIVTGAVGILNSLNVRIDPATEATLSVLASKDFATETTLATLGTEATLSSLEAKDFATETTLAAIKTDADRIDVNLSSRATEATLSALNTKVTTTANGVKVDGSAVTQPVSGTFWQAVQPVSGTFWQATQPISAASLPLPTGASTEATLSALNTKVVITANGIKVDGTATTQPISAASLPLPTGAATEATLGTRLADATFTARVNTLGQKTSLLSTPVVIASDQSPVSTSVTSSALPTGAATEATLSSLNSKDFATETTLSLIKTDADRLDVNLSTRASETTVSGIKSQTDQLTFIATRLLVDGSGVTQPISAASLPLPTGAATSALQSTINTSLTNGTQKTQIVDGAGNVVGSTSNALDVNIKSGVTLSVNLDHSNDSVLIYGNDGTNDQKVKTDASGNVQVGVVSSVLPTGASTSALQTTGNASLSSIDSKTPPLGQAVSASSVPVVLASDQSEVPVASNPTEALYVTESYVTTNAFSSARPGNGDFNFRRFKTKEIVIINSGANPALINVFGSVDNGVNYDVIISNNITVNAGVTTLVDESRSLTHIQVQAKSKNVGAPTTIVTRAYALGV